MGNTVIPEDTILIGSEESKELKSIEKEKLLAVEGMDEVNFFNALFKHIGIQDVDIRDMAGKYTYKYNIPSLISTTGFRSNVRVLGIVKDADENPQATFESIRNILKNEELSTPETINEFTSGKPKVGIYIMPGNLEEGMLEDLCLKTVADHPAMDCVNEFISCVEELENKPKNIAKAKSQTFLSAMPEIVNSVGLGALKHYWNFNSDVLDELKKFLYNFK